MPFSVPFLQFALIHAMRSYLHVDMDAGLCRILPLPPELESCGGRALASLLAAQKPGRLCLSPGLLTGCRCASAGRCAVSCSQAGGRVLHSNAGGNAGPALAALGLAALVIEPRRGAKKELHDLVIGDGQAHTVPAATQGLYISSGMEKLASAFPEAAALISSGPAGECCLPMASLAFSDHRFRPTSHAGSRSGVLLCGGGLHSIVILKKAKGREGESRELAEASRNFMEALRSVRGEGGVSSRGCTSGCVLDCHKSDAFQPKAGKKGGKAGWPGFREHWSSGDETADALHMKRFMLLCDELGVDTVALGHVMLEAAEHGLFPSGDAEAALNELEKLAVPGSSPLCDLAKTWSDAAEKPGAKEESLQDVVMDCLGICRFAADAVVQKPAVRDAAMEMVRCLHGLSPDDLYRMASRVLLAESGQGWEKGGGA